MAEEEKYVLTPYGCKVGVLMDYGIDVSHFTLKMGEHMVDTGYISKKQEGEEHGQTD